MGEKALEFVAQLWQVLLRAQEDKITKASAGKDPAPSAEHGTGKERRRGSLPRRATSAEDRPPRPAWSSEHRKASAEKDREEAERIKRELELLKGGPTRRQHLTRESRGSYFDDWRDERGDHNGRDGHSREGHSREWEGGRRRHTDRNRNEDKSWETDRGDSGRDWGRDCGRRKERESQSWRGGGRGRGWTREGQDRRGDGEDGWWVRWRPFGKYRHGRRDSGSSEDDRRQGSDVGERARRPGNDRFEERFADQSEGESQGEGKRERVGERRARRKREKDDFSDRESEGEIQSKRRLSVSLSDDERRSETAPKGEGRGKEKFRADCEREGEGAGRRKQPYSAPTGPHEEARGGDSNRDLSSRQIRYTKRRKRFDQSYAPPDLSDAFSDERSGRYERPASPNSEHSGGDPRSSYNRMKRTTERDNEREGQDDREREADWKRQWSRRRDTCDTGDAELREPTREGTSSEMPSAPSNERWSARRDSLTVPPRRESVDVPISRPGNIDPDSYEAVDRPPSLDSDPKAERPISPRLKPQLELRPGEEVEGKREKDLVERESRSRRARRRGLGCYMDDEPGASAWQRLADRPSTPERAGPLQLGSQSRSQTSPPNAHTLRDGADNDADHKDYDDEGRKLRNLVLDRLGRARSRERVSGEKDSHLAS